MEKIFAETLAPPPIPKALYHLGAASGLLGEKFFVQPTIPSRILDRLIRSTDNADGPASYKELFALAHTPDFDSSDATADAVNASQALRYSLRRLRQLFGEEFFAQTGEAPHSPYQRREPDKDLARRFTRPVIETSIEHAAKRHLLATNRPVLLEFANHLLERYAIQDPVEQEMLRSVVLLAGLPFNFQHRNPDIMRARVAALKSVREKLDGLRREVLFVKDGKPRTRQRIHPIGALHRTCFVRPEWLADVEGFRSLEEILEAHRKRFGLTLPLGFFGPTQMTMPFPRPAPAATENGHGNGNGAHPSTIVEAVRLTGLEGQVFMRRRTVDVVDLSPSVPFATSVPAPQSPE